MHENTSIVRDNHLLLARTLSSALPEMIKVSTALALVARGANIFEIDRNEVAQWMETAAANGQWKLVDFYVYQLSNLQVVRSSSGAPSAVVSSAAFKQEKSVSNMRRHQATASASDDDSQDSDLQDRTLAYV